MGFFKTLFGGKETTAEEKQEQKEQYNFEVLTYDGTQALRIGKTDYAIACLERALSIREDEETRRSLARAYTHADNLEKAAEQYAILSQNVPENASYPLAEAETYFQLERYEEMEKACQHALAIDAQLAMPHYFIARGAKAQEEQQKAIDEATLALEAKPDYDEARLLRAESYTALRQYAEAEADIDILLACETVSDDVLMQKAAICTATERDEEAIDYYQRVIEQNPFIPAAYIALSAVQKKQGRHADAAKTISDAIEQLGADPADAERLSQTEFTSIDDYMRNAYNALNPYQLGVSL